MVPMVGEGVHFSLFRGSRSGGDVAPSREFQEFWLSLSRWSWDSLVLVPADVGISTADVATSLADVGGRLRDSPVTAVVAEKLDFESARMLSDLQLSVRDSPPVPNGHTIPVEAKVVSPDAAPSAVSRPVPEISGLPVARPLPPAGRVIVSIQPVVVEPLGVAIAHAADAVVLCVRMGATRMKAARRTLELVGPERVIGAFLVR
jgi:hypothetical protein